MPPDRCGKCTTCLYLAVAKKLCNFAPGKMMDASSTANFWNHAISQPCLMPPEGMTAYDPERDYLATIQEENGNYQGKCFCGSHFRGPKRAMTCLRCERLHHRVHVLIRLQDLYCGMMVGSTAYTMDTCLSDLKDNVKEDYYRAVFATFREWCEVRRVTFLSFNRDVANNMEDLASLLTDLGIQPYYISPLG